MHMIVVAENTPKIDDWHWEERQGFMRSQGLIPPSNYLLITKWKWVTLHLGHLVEPSLFKWSRLASGCKHLDLVLPVVGPKDFVHVRAHSHTIVLLGEYSIALWDPC
jgi:hypothetical protein